MVGALQYLTMTRPDIHYTYCFLVYACSSRTTHLFCVQRISKYLQGTVDHGLILCPSRGVSLIYPIQIVVVQPPAMQFSLPLKETTYSLKVFHGGEYHAAAYTFAHMLWICSLLTVLGLVLRQPVNLLYDNISATYLTVNLVQFCRSKHIKTDYQFIREHVVHGDLIVHFVPTQFQLADIFTKSLSSQHSHFSKSNLHVVPPCTD